MATMAEMLPVLDDKELVTLRSNAQRLEQSATEAKQRTAAAELLPLIEAEIADRKAKAPPPVRKTRAKKAEAAAEASAEPGEAEAKPARAPAKPRAKKAAA